ncbi:MAG: heavy-metal-associated domain-containing protein [Thermomicrobiales bacterium]
MVTMYLKSPDISCDRCVATVKRTAGQFAGVEAVDADVNTQTITLTYDPTKADLVKIADALEEEGYQIQR